MLRIKNLSFKLDTDRLILDQINTVFQPNEVYGIAGKSGVGKSTLLKIIAGIKDASTGDVFLNDRKLPRASQRLIPGHPEMSLVAQDYKLDLYHTCTENIREVILNWEPVQREQRVRQLIKLLELDDVAHAIAKDLSGGEQQRLALARAIAKKPSWLLLDEPFSHLDSVLKARLINLLIALKEKERLIYGLMKANKTAATGALSASIAHELNQPLGASSLNIQFLKMKLEKGVLNPELGKEILDSLENDNKRAATIVKSLRSIFTEGESNAQEVQLGDLIVKVLDIVKPELKSKNIQIQLRVDDGLVIKVNPAEIEQVMLNLVNNAAQALANAGTLQRRIAIEAIKAGQLVRLTVSDNGNGVPVEFKSHLFELLSTTKQTGMGLGLWLCKHIVTRYGGSIYYEDAVGSGAKFVIKLPSS